MDTLDLNQVARQINIPSSSLKISIESAPSPEQEAFDREQQGLDAKARRSREQVVFYFAVGLTTIIVGIMVFFLLTEASYIASSSSPQTNVPNPRWQVAVAVLPALVTGLFTYLITKAIQSGKSS